MIIGLHGSIGAGKDTVADILCRRHDFARLSFAGPLKDGLIAMFGLRREQLEHPAKEMVIRELGKSPRDLLRTLGTEWGRRLVADDLWIGVAERNLRFIRTFASRIVITDVRFENEAEWLRRIGGQLWHVLRPFARDNVIEFGARHASDEPLPVVVGEDSIVANDAGIEQLGDEVKRALAGECVVRGILLTDGDAR